MDASVSSLLRYAAAPQLLFAAGFFFMWLDPERYSSYRPLLAVGKLALVVCFLPLAASLLRDPNATGSTLGVPFLGIYLAVAVAVVDVASLCILALGGGHAASASAEKGPSAPVKPGQGPGDIEQVESY